MYGHALAELARRGTRVPEGLVERTRRGLAFLLRRRARELRSGLILLTHPWESGADNCPRWDDLCPGGFEVERWRERKGELVRSIVRSASGAPIANPGCVVASVGFNALVAFNALELLTIIDDPQLRTDALELVAAIDAQWDDDLGTWVDAGATETGSGRVRTLDALLPVLVTSRSAAQASAFASMTDRAAFGAEFGPSAVHQSEESFAPSVYWRGPAWPQLSYLVWFAAVQADCHETAAQLAESTVRGALVSGLAEYWQPFTGAGLGAIPQSWTGLALVIARRYR